jgi:hypothetical protein
MKKYFLKVDWKTLKKNADAGSTESPVPGCECTMFKVYKLPSCFKEGVNCTVTGYDLKDGGCNFEGYIIDPKLAFEIREQGISGVELIQTKLVHRIRHAPIPEYSYNYENKKLKCEYCGEAFRYLELKAECGEDSCSDKICPKCGAWDCVSIEYEKLEDALKRKK